MAFAGGTGTVGDPYLVSAADQLNDVRNYLTSSFKQINDINLSSYVNWVPIGTPGTGTYFQGNYDGGNFNITGLTINTPTVANIGLFGACSPTTGTSELKNINLVNVNVSGKDIVGALGGEIIEYTVTNCHSSGSITTTSDAGGLIGWFDPWSTSMASCSSSCSVTSTGSNTYCVGGLIGYATGITIEKCFATGNVTAVSGYAGGLIGSCYANTVQNCYAMGNVSGVDRVGGFIGEAYLDATINCYSKGAVTGTTNVGGFIGKKGTYTVITNCYYDTQTSNHSDSDKGIPTSTTNMKTQSTFINWDFSTPIWYLNTNNDGYPCFVPGEEYLKMFVKEGGIWYLASKFLK